MTENCWETVFLYKYLNQQGCYHKYFQHPSLDMRRTGLLNVARDGEEGAESSQSFLRQQADIRLYAGEWILY